MTGTYAAMRRTSGWWLPTLFLLAFLAAGFCFARSQDVWIDESTQLSGAALPLPAMLRWLGGMPLPLGVPADRMPPVSYLFDSALLRLTGEDVFGLRIIHLLVAAAGLSALLAAIVRRFGAGAGLLAAALLLLAPRLIESAVEVRAYPLFLALTCAQLIVFLRLLDRAVLTAAPLAGFVLLGLLAIYTHFFALVATSALFVGLAVTRLGKPRALLLLGGAYLLLLAGSAGLAPFVRGSAAASGRMIATGLPGAHAILLYLLRLIGHSSTMLAIPAAILALGGFVGLLGLALLGFLRRLAGAPAATLATPEAALWAALAAGLAVTLVAAMLIAGFDPLKPVYSLWTFPLFVLLAIRAVAPEQPLLLRRLSLAAASCFGIGGLWSTSLFLLHADWFAHGPERPIAEALGKDTDATAVVYTSSIWPYAFFPLAWRYHNQAPQWWRDPEGGFHRLLRGGAVDPEAHGLAVFANDQRLIYADIELQSYRELRDLRAGIPLPSQAEPAAPTGFRHVDTVEHPGLYGLDLTVFERKKPS